MDGEYALELRIIRNSITVSDNLLTKELHDGVKLLKNPKLTINKLDKLNHTALKKRFIKTIMLEDKS